MVGLRRQALGIMLGALGSCASICQALPETAVQLRLELTHQRGGPRLVNFGSVPVTIRYAIDVEQEFDHEWVAVLTEFHAVAQCGEPIGEQVEIPPAATLAIVPWQGYSCSGQCAASCRANIYYGPGIFRFVVTIAPMGQRFVSPAFTLPAQSSATR